MCPAEFGRTVAAPTIGRQSLREIDQAGQSQNFGPQIPSRAADMCVYRRRRAQ